MKTKLKILKAIEQDGEALAVGTICRVENELAMKWCFDGTAERMEEGDVEDITGTVKSAVDDAIKGLKIGDQIKTAVGSITTKGEAVDPSWGYGAPLAAGQERSKGAKLHNAAMYLRDVKEANGGTVPERLQKAMEICEKAAGTPGQVIGNDPDGGFAVPTETRMELDGATLDASPVRAAATILPMSTKSLERTRVQDYTHASGAVSGGAVAYWEGENDTLTSSKIQTEKVKHDLSALTALGFMSHQAMKFSAISGGLLVQELGKAIALAEECAFLTSGTGAGQPQAIMKSDALISIARQVAGSVILTDIQSMYARLRVKSEASVKWLMNRTLFPKIASLNLAVGTGGAPVFIPGNDASKGIPNTLYGYPIHWSEYPSALGTAGDIILGDFSEYEIGDFVEGPEVAESMHIKFLEAQTAFRIIKYVDGQVSPKKVFTPKNGDTLSPFITLTDAA